MSETTPAIRQAAATDWITYFDDLAKGELSGRIVRFDKERPEEPVSASRWLLDDFVGTYRHAGFGTLHIEPRGEYLWFRIDGLSGFDGPLVRYSGLSFEYQGDRDAMAWPVIAVAKATRGECARVRFRAGDNEIEGLDWFDWFGEAKFSRISTPEPPLLTRSDPPRLTAAVGSGRGQRDYPTIPGSANGIGKGTETWESQHFRTTRKPDKRLVGGGDEQRGG
jgi:hypothetical protein